jgi:archaellum component FlaG (FlaF/FlaG flagellin family)
MTKAIIFTDNGNVNIIFDGNLIETIDYINKILPNNNGFKIEPEQVKVKTLKKGNVER